jgi:hypothetical protein
MNAALWILLGTALAFLGAVLLAVGGEDEDWALIAAWPVLYGASIMVTIGVIAAGIRVAAIPHR